jgi:Fibronectin type III domain.
MKSPNSSWQQSYRGKDTDYIITELSPGQTYVFHVRAFNRVGVSTSHFVIPATGNLVFCKSHCIAFYTVLINAEASDN